ncbi:MAG TPA: hypothetical protein VMU85_15690, partial [Stellaceae bacterium]|nr:hypothetical protein [Stellaceae bacterium]
MRVLAAALISAPLLLAGTLPAGAQSSSGSTDHDSYTKQAEDQVELWKQKLGDAGDKAASTGKDVGQKAAATGKDAGDAADKHLKQAWHKTQEAADKLQT